MKVTLPQLSPFQIRHAERISAIDFEDNELLVLWGPLQRLEGRLTYRVQIDKSDPDALRQLAQVVRDQKGWLPGDVEDRLKIVVAGD
jgi:hypothetical protein